MGYPTFCSDAFFSIVIRFRKKRIGAVFFEVLVRCVWTTLDLVQSALMETAMRFSDRSPGP